MSNCECVYSDYSDYEQVTIFEQKIVKARKLHRCYVCDRPIQKGEEYERVKGVMDDLFTNKTCPDCLSIRDVFFCEGGCYEFMEDLWEHLQAIGGQVKSECLEALTPAARNTVIDMIDQTWGRMDRADEMIKKFGRNI